MSRLVGGVPSSAALDILCVPDAEWDAALWTNRQHMMLELAANPHVRVLYVAPPRFFLSRHLRRRRLRARVAGSRTGLFTRRIEDRLWVHQPLLPLPNGLLRRHAPAAVDWLILWSMRRALRQLGFTQPVLWSYTPLAERLRGRLGERLVCYDVVDHYPTQPNYARLGPRLAEDDLALTRAADVVLTTSALLHGERARLNANTHLVGNAADIGLFATARSATAAPAELAGLDGPIIGFHGAVAAYKLDLGLVRDIARRRRGWNLVLVGPVFDREVRAALESEPNVSCLGFREPHALPAYLARFDVCVIPYRRSSYTEHVNALKLRECLAAGKPVVATRLPGFPQLDGRIALTEGTDGFIAEVERLLANPPAPLPLDAPELAAFTWSAKAARTLDVVERALHMERACASV